MSYSVTIDVFRENYLRIIKEAFDCLSGALTSISTNDKPRATAVREKIIQLLEKIFKEIFLLGNYPSIISFIYLFLVKVIQCFKVFESH